jgi:hypothetical protein
MQGKQLWAVSLVIGGFVLVSVVIEKLTAPRQG